MDDIWDSCRKAINDKVLCAIFPLLTEKFHLEVAAEEVTDDGNKKVVRRALCAENRFTLIYNYAPYSFALTFQRNGEKLTCTVQLGATIDFNTPLYREFLNLSDRLELLFHPASKTELDDDGKLLVTEPAYVTARCDATAHENNEWSHRENEDANIGEALDILANLKFFLGAVSSKFLDSLSGNQLRDV